MKLINADRTVETLMGLADKEYGNQHYLNGIRTALELIGNEPEAVVRCGDCMMFDEDGADEADEGEGWCWWVDAIVKLHDYCSYGERSEDERVHSADIR